MQVTLSATVRNKPKCAGQYRLFGAAKRQKPKWPSGGEFEAQETAAAQFAAALDRLQPAAQSADEGRHGGWHYSQPSAAACGLY